MLAHYHGQTWNGSELAGALGVSDKTVSRYLDILEGTFMAFRLPPWHTNLGKREVKAPKVYVSDTGILHRLLGVGGLDDLPAHPKCGASWEGFMVREIIRRVGAQRGEVFFWGVHTGVELGLDGLWVACHGEGDPWPLAEGITAVPASYLASPHWRPE